MLEDSHIDGAKNLLINICASEKVSMAEVNEICGIVTASADQDYNMYWGQVISPDMVKLLHFFHQNQVLTML